LGSFSRALCHELVGRRPRTLIAAGHAPIRGNEIVKLRAAGVRCINYSTDDPWNPTHRAGWHLDALREYDIVFTPRTSNIEDLRALGCRDVRHLPFGYDEDLFKEALSREIGLSEPVDVLLVGGADRDRVGFVTEVMKAGLRPTLAGGYWDHHRHLRDRSLGIRSAEDLRTLTAHAGVNLCLVRRANRDGHVMRSFEIPACGGFMIAEDTAEHREIFGPEGECVLYFANAEEAAQKTRQALADPAARRRMALAAHRRITRGANTYRDRLNQMLEALPA
jgi:spore maturation protein CgeB